MLDPYQKSLSKMFMKIAKYTFSLCIYLFIPSFIYLFVYLFVYLVLFIYFDCLFSYLLSVYFYFYKKQKTLGKILEKVSAFLVSINC